MFGDQISKNGIGYQFVLVIWVSDRVNMYYVMWWAKPSFDSLIELEMIILVNLV